MLRFVFLSFLIFCLDNLHAQEKVLYGFGLGQSKSAVKNEFKTPFKTGTYNDGSQYEIYLLNPDKSAYIVFEYQVSQPDVIGAIQVSGSDSSIDLGLKGLHLGDDKAKVEKALGKPHNSQKVEGEGELWNYGNYYSLEFSEEGKLSSFKMMNNYRFEIPDVNQSKSFSELVQILQTGNNEAIMNVISPGIKINYIGKSVFFSKSLKSEIKNDTSNVFSTLRQISNGLEALDVKNPYMFEESAISEPGKRQQLIYKIKSAHIINEIILELNGGRFLIKEIKGN